MIQLTKVPVTECLLYKSDGRVEDCQPAVPGSIPASAKSKLLVYISYHNSNYVMKKVTVIWVIHPHGFKGKTSPQLNKSVNWFKGFPSTFNFIYFMIFFIFGFSVTPCFELLGGCKIKKN